jgi:sugar lactone lactonase YvrE
MTSLLHSFSLKKEDFFTVGSDLHRPECVWTDRDGIWVSDNRGGVGKISASGQATLLGSGIAEPNGFCRRPDGSFLVGGLSDGKLHIIKPNGETSVYLHEIDGEKLGVVNHAWYDRQGRTWISVMTRSKHWHDKLHDRNPDGYIILIDDNGARIVADGLDLTNEVKVSPDGRYLFAAETLGRCIVRFAILDKNKLGPKEYFGPKDLGPGSNPDGLTIDSEGNIWIALIAKNGIGVITSEGDYLELFTDINSEGLKKWLNASEHLAAKPDDLVDCAGEMLKLPTSIAFGGEDMKTVYIGSLLLPHLCCFRSPVPG